MVDKFSATLKSIVAAIHAVLGFVLSAGLALGLIVPNSTENPIVFENSDECLMSFVALADTHTRETKINTFYLECGLNDIANSEEEFDALLIAGDLTEFGDGISYNALWDKLDNSVFADKPILLATGNHDIRLAYEAQTAMIMQKAGEYLDMDINKPYYSYDVNGYTFIVMGSDEWQLEKAIISDEQLEFLESQLYLLSVAEGFVIIGVDGHRPNLDYTRISCRRTSPEQRFHPGDQLPDGERLRHVVVGTQLQAQNLIHL